jgi:hypothetical protein
MDKAFSRASRAPPRSTEKSGEEAEAGGEEADGAGRGSGTDAADAGGDAGSSGGGAVAQEKKLTKKKIEIRPVSILFIRTIIINSYKSRFF